MRTSMRGFLGAAMLMAALGSTLAGETDLALGTGAIGLVLMAWASARPSRNESKDF